MFIAKPLMLLNLVIIYNMHMLIIIINDDEKQNNKYFQQ